MRLERLRRKVVIAPEIDVAVLTRQRRSINHEVEAALRSQLGVLLKLHQIVAEPESDDTCRWDAIVRGRNRGKQVGKSPWVMFVDDDVVLDPHCARRLLQALIRSPYYAAFGADYLGEGVKGRVAPHVTMGATLFRRQALAELSFRWHDNRCECQCCCDDLRRRNWGVDYCPAAKANHKKRLESAELHTARDLKTSPIRERPEGVVFAAFDRRHLPHFCKQFLKSLRASGNQELVMALAIGLRPSERRRLSTLPRVQPTFLPDNGQVVPRRRLIEFPRMAMKLPSDTPIAYWDVGDVIFQDSLQPLWESVHRHPDKILAVREPFAHPENPIVAKWTLSIRDPAARQRAFDLLSKGPHLNSGFAAGTPRALVDYMKPASSWFDSPTLRGTSDWGDQTALNLYCHSHADAWQELPEGWNYCLAGRRRGQVSRNADGKYLDSRRIPIYAIHGNASTLLMAPWQVVRP